MLLRLLATDLYLPTPRILPLPEAFAPGFEEPPGPATQPAESGPSAEPTTYAGSEVTPVLGETTDGVKTTRSSPELAPRTVIYDVELTIELPAALSVTSGINARP